MLEFLAGWYNWPFLLSFFVGFGLAGVTLLGAGHHDVGGHSLDLNGDGVPDVGHDIGHDANHDVAKGSLHLSWLAWMGVGRAPLTVLLEVMLVSFGLIGLLVNAVASDLATWLTWVSFPVALVVSGVCSLSITKGVAMFFVKYAPSDAPTSRQKGEFIGSIGIAISTITSSIGQVRVEGSGAPAYLNVCLAEGTNSTIARETEVLFVGYDSKRKMYLVIPNNTES